MKPRERLIVALDVPSLDEALRFADTVAGHVGWLKVGLELFTRAGPEGVREINSRAPVMLDLKLHDIPATVSRTIKALAELEVGMATIHAAGGAQMIKAAADAAPSLKLLGVTVLTSLDQTAAGQVGIADDIRNVVAQRASLAVANGCGGVVASPKEASLLRRLLGPGPLIVTPGIRPSGSSEGDQKRVATPRSAIAGGADLVVVGRPIRDADDPAEAARAITNDIAAGLEFQ